MPVMIVVGMAVLAACSGGSDRPATTVAATTTAGSPGPLVVSGDLLPLPPSGLDGLLMDDAGNPVLVFQTPGSDGEPVARVQVGDPTVRPSLDLPTGISTGRVLAAATAPFDELVFLAHRLDDVDGFVLVVLRAAPGRPVSELVVPDSGVERFATTSVAAVSADGSSAVVAQTPRSTTDTGADPRLSGRATLTRIDLLTGIVIARQDVDLGSGGPDLLDISVGPDGAVSLLLAPVREGPRLARFDAALEPQGQVELDPTAESDRTRLAAAPDGTVFASMVSGVDPGGLTARLVQVAPGADRADLVIDLPGGVVDAIAAAPTGWLYVSGPVGAEPGARLALRAVELATGQVGDPVPLCEAARPSGLAASPDGETLALTLSCGGDPGVLTLATSD